MGWCGDRGLLTFLCNVGTNKIAQGYADKVVEGCTGIVTHDAGNSLYSIFGCLTPLSKYVRQVNQRAAHYALERGKPGIAVSSSHWLPQIGSAGIETNEEIESDSGENFLRSLGSILERRKHGIYSGYNSQLEVLRFGMLLRKHGSSPDRFRQESSSYNH